MISKKKLSDYSTHFLFRYELTSRHGLHIEKESMRIIKQIVHNIGDERLTVSGFVENVLKHHLATYKDEINGLHELKKSKLIK